jgi:uncharacterized protein (TIGR02118 family)
MFKMMILLRKRENMSDGEFSKYFLEVHAPLAKKMPLLRKYVVNLVKPPPNREPDFSGVAELWFDDTESMKKAFAASEGQATQKDSEKFTSKTITMFIDEHPIT